MMLKVYFGGHIWWHFQVTSDLNLGNSGVTWDIGFKDKSPACKMVKLIFCTLLLKRSTFVDSSIYFVLYSVVLCFLMTGILLWKKKSSFICEKKYCWHFSHEQKYYFSSVSLYGLFQSPHYASKIYYTSEISKEPSCSHQRLILWRDSSTLYFVMQLWAASNVSVYANILDDWNYCT